MPERTKDTPTAILIIDDDPVFRRLMAVMFSQDGLSVTTAADAESGLKLIEQKLFQVAVVDYRLPDMNGVDFFERTRRTHPQMIRILLTAHTTEEVLLDSINRGEVYRYLTKPVHMGLLRSTVDQAFTLYDLATTRASLVAELERQNRELEEKNQDLRTYYHLMGELKAQQDQILASLPEPFLLLRADRRIIKCNQAAIEMLGYSRGELLGHSADELFTIDRELPARIEDVGRTGLSYFESDLRRKDSRLVRVKIALNRFQSENDERSQIALVLQDISSVKQLEAILRDHSQQLEETVEDQIMQIVRQQKALAHSEKLASLGTLVAGAAHEINTSSSFVSTNVEVLQHYWENLLPILEGWVAENREARIGRQSAGKVVQDISGLLGDLQVGSKQLTHIVEGMLAFSRKDVRKKEAFDPTKAVETSLTVISTRLNKFFNVKRHFVAGTPAVFGNKSQVVQVIVDLMMNACDAWEGKEAGRRTEMMIVVRPTQARRMVRITIADRAGGIPAEAVEHIFDPFFTTKHGKGTGLGLAICHGIIGEHGGEIWVKNRPGCGASFNFNLPSIELSELT